VCGEVLEIAGRAKEIKVIIYGRWTSYAYMKEKKETSCSCFKWNWEGVEEER
jgi:hypothetical protein